MTNYIFIILLIIDSSLNLINIRYNIYFRQLAKFTFNVLNNKTPHEQVEFRTFQNTTKVSHDQGNQISNSNE